MKKEIPELKILELNKLNIMKTFKQCQATSNTQKPICISFYSDQSKRTAPIVEFDPKELISRTALFRYWLGQLKVIHQYKSKIITSDGLFNYKNEKWTDDTRVLFALYYLSTGSAALPQFVDGEKFAEINNLAMSYAAGLKPTYPPSDPNFKLEDARKALACLGVKLPDDITHLD